MQNPEALCSKKADGVGLVDEEDAVVSLFDGDDLLEGCEGARGAVDGFGEDEARPVLFDLRLEAGRVVMFEEVQFDAAGCEAIVEGHVEELVGVDVHALVADGVHDSDVGGVAGLGEVAVFAEPGCEVLFEGSLRVEFREEGRGADVVGGVAGD